MLLALSTIGFVLLSDIRPNGSLPVAPTAPSAPQTTAVVTTDALNVRDGASLDATVLDTLPQGARIEIVGSNRNGFTPVRYGTGLAWMAAEFLDVDGLPDMDSTARREDLSLRSASETSLTQPDVSGTRTEDMAVEPGVPPAETDAGSREAGVSAGVAEPDSPNAAPIDAASEAINEPGPSMEDSVAPEFPLDTTISEERWIEVERSTGLVTLHEGETIVAIYHGKVGKDPSADGFYSTALGTFHVFSMNRELAPTPLAEGVYLTDFVGFDPERSNGFHSPIRDQWGNEMPSQNATTLGCVRLDADAAVAVFDFSSIGMRVEIHE